MSFRERAAWISLAVTTVVWGYYFWVVGQSLAMGEAGDWPMGLFVRCVIISTIAQIILQIPASLSNADTERSMKDEREIRIDGRGTAVAYALLTVLVIVVAVGGAVYPGVPTREGTLILDSRVDAQMLMANGVILAVVIAEVAKCLVVVGLHRLGRG